MLCGGSSRRGRLEDSRLGFQYILYCREDVHPTLQRSVCNCLTMIVGSSYIIQGAHYPHRSANQCVPLHNRGRAHLCLGRVQPVHDTGTETVPETGHIPGTVPGTFTGTGTVPGAVNASYIMPIIDIIVCVYILYMTGLLIWLLYYIICMTLGPAQPVLAYFLY